MCCFIYFIFLHLNIATQGSSSFDKVGTFVDIKPSSSCVMWIDVMVLSSVVELEMVVCSECSAFTCPA